MITFFFFFLNQLARGAMPSPAESTQAGFSPCCRTHVAAAAQAAFFHPAAENHRDSSDESVLELELWRTRPKHQQADIRLQWLRSAEQANIGSQQQLAEASQEVEGPKGDGSDLPHVHAVTSPDVQTSDELK